MRNNGCGTHGEGNGPKESPTSSKLLQTIWKKKSWVAEGKMSTVTGKLWPSRGVKKKRIFYDFKGSSTITNNNCTYREKKEAMRCRIWCYLYGNHG